MLLEPFTVDFFLEFLISSKNALSGKFSATVTAFSVKRFLAGKDIADLTQPYDFVRH